jgi:hypothetical protein
VKTRGLPIAREGAIHTPKESLDIEAITPPVGIGVTGKVLASGLQNDLRAIGYAQYLRFRFSVVPEPGECARIEIRNASALTFTKPRRIDTQGPATPAILLRR